MTVKHESLTYQKVKLCIFERIMPGDHVTPGLSPRFTDRFDGPYKLAGHYYSRKDLLKIQDQSGNVMKPVHI